MRRYISFLLLVLVLRRVFDPMKTKARVLFVLLFFLFLGNPFNLIKLFLYFIELAKIIVHLFHLDISYYVHELFFQVFRVQDLRLCQLLGLLSLLSELLVLTVLDFCD